MKKLVEQFLLYGTNDVKYRAAIYQDVIDASSHDGPATILGLKSCQLQDGTPLNSVDEDTFVNPLTLERLMRKPV
ncbi:MAG: hypothetical protein ACJ71U_17650 [Terriglobales bacterium]